MTAHMQSVMQQHRKYGPAVTDWNVLHGNNVGKKLWNIVSRHLCAFTGWCIQVSMCLERILYHPHWPPNEVPLCMYVCMYVCQQVKSDLECRQIDKVPVVRSQKVKGQGHRVTKSKNTWWTKLACIIGTVDDVSHSCHIGTVFFGSLCGNILSCEFYWWANGTCLLLLNRKFLPCSFSVRDFPIE